MTATEVGGALILSNLEGDGSPSDLIAAIRAIQEVKERTTVYITVDFDNPRKQQLMKVYKHFGAVEKAVVLEVV